MDSATHQNGKLAFDAYLAFLDWVYNAPNPQVREEKMRWVAGVYASIRARVDVEVVRQSAPNLDKVSESVRPDRAELARQLLGAGRRFSPDRDAAADLCAERAATD